MITGNLIWILTWIESVQVYMDNGKFCLLCDPGCIFKNIAL